VRDETRRLMSSVAEISAEVRLPLIDMAIPALRGLTPDQYAVFAANVRALVEADRKVELFEWTLQRILLHHLAPAFEGVRAPRARYGSLDRVKSHCGVVLSLLAYAGGRSPQLARLAFDAGARELGVRGLSLLPAGQCGLAEFDTALAALSGLVPPETGRWRYGCAVAVSADREVTVMEAELLRATADSLGGPMPPLLPGQQLT